MEALKLKLKRYRKELAVCLCSALYLGWFFVLERTVTDNYHIIHVGLDDYIPFCEYFIVPYLFWFAYVLITLVWLYRNERKAFFRSCAFLFTGMFISLFICTFYPNGTNFRPYIDPDKNVFSAAVALLYKADTCTNVLPSIHVYNSIGIHAAILRSEKLKNKRLVKAASFVSCVLICLATVFLKQHSVVDVFAAMLMAYVVYEVVYEPVSMAEAVSGKRKLGKPESIAE